MNCESCRAAAQRLDKSLGRFPGISGDILRWAIEMWYELSRWHRHEKPVVLWLSRQDYDELMRHLRSHESVLTGNKVREGRVYGMDLRWSLALQAGTWVATVPAENERSEELVAAGLWRVVL